ncbi:hypothetical protein COF42_25620 [Bacillus wiedmannii]|uniref:DNA-3-methyladenine glycosylase family protein n=1 Tax=Bacillus wiedmannii TaxID=1890302 RepID=UPI000BFDB37C|nr:DNA-3-methyladenine glycosylase [Bacillus wiedmannii]PHC82973.1 hypothetical protein COF42_25620 [Bacillus wiedmannii]
MNNYQKEGYLYPVAPFDFEKSINFTKNFIPMNGEQDFSELTLIKAVELSEISVVFSVQSIGTTSKPKLHYKIYSVEPLDTYSHQEALDRIDFFLSLQDNLTPFYEIGYHDKIFKPIINELYGYHQVKFLTPFENACWAVISQRSSLALSKITKDKLIKIYGDELSFNGKTFYTFPSPNKLIKVSENDLNDIVNNTKKTQYLMNTIKAFNSINETNLRKKNYEDLKHWLLSIKGIGEWSASFILLRGFGKMEELPIAEKVLENTSHRLYFDYLKHNNISINDISNKYGTYKGYWAHYIRVANSM